MPSRTPLRIAMIGSYVPRRCGIATFTHDLSNAMQGNGAVAKRCNVQIVAMNDRQGQYAYGDEVMLELHQHRREDYRNAAEVLNDAKIDVVSLQHEYGLFGGDCGDYLLDLLDRLRKPLISTPHSVLSDPTPKQREILEAVCDKSSMVAVMANRARMILNETYGVPLKKVKLIPHGVPDVPFGDTEPFKERFGLAGRPMILTFGLLGPGKGIETVLEALADVVSDHPDVAYVVLGVTHPSVKRESGELYRISLELRAVELGIQKNVLFHNRYVSNDDLREYLQAADIYVTPYRHKEQITSGTLVYALAAGKAIISTPYWHAQELLVNGRGRLVDFGSVPEFSTALRELLGDPRRRKEMGKAAYDFGRSMVWSRVGEQYVEEFEIARRNHAEAPRAEAQGRRILMRMSLPDRRLDHLFVMTDGTGILQHACYSTPDRNHGYCTDDNARALIVAAMAWSLFQDEEVLPQIQTYLSFLHYAQMPETGRLRNFMSYDRRWLESDGSDDCQGRAIWALGYLIAHAPMESMKTLATDMFRAAVSATST
ncbi:MAG: glycosyltransferase family 4 protein, partial [Planctomycetes bacterium]|nr:glycosyltransferase family 4 protein [Planctomycetota bacterium]